MIKKIRLEFCLFIFLLLSILITYDFDVWIFNFFSQLNYGFGSDSLNIFFVKITELGDSLWYFLIIFLILVISYLMKIIKLISLKNYFFLKKFSIFSFTYLLLVGLVTQLIKHVIGRPRPNHAQLNNFFEFNFFTADSAFHSFPSGHSSTIIAVAIIASLALPTLKYFFYLCGFLISISRVVVGAHFFTDVLAGALLAVLIYKFYNSFIKIKYPNFYWQNLSLNENSLIFKILIIFFVLAVFVTIGPDIDIFVSGLFYLGDNQFLLQSYYFISILFRKILLPLLLVYIFLLPIILKFLPIKKIYFGYKFSISEIIFVWVSGTVTMLPIINIGLKNMWGRARPDDILNFGGNYGFTPWYTISNSCSSNCSFVSGDASVGFLLVVFYFLTKKNAYLYLALFFGAFLGFIRIIAGGHFLSDVIFSQLVVIFATSISFILYKKLYDK